MKFKEIKKAARSISRAEVLAVIESEGGSPQRYCILRLPGESMGTTYLIDETGTLLGNLDGDEVFEYARMQYLEEHGVRVLESMSDLLKFQAELQIELAGGELRDRKNYACPQCDSAVVKILLPKSVRTMLRLANRPTKAMYRCSEQPCLWSGDDPVGSHERAARIKSERDGAKAGQRDPSPND